MPKEEWGVKRLCPHCSTRFYDLNRDPMTCPNCGNSFELAAFLAGNTQPLKVTAEKAAEADDLVDADDLLEDDADVDLGDDLLEDDDDDDTVPIEEIADVAKDDDE